MWKNRTTRWEIYVSDSHHARKTTQLKFQIPSHFYNQFQNCHWMCPDPVFRSKMLGRFILAKKEPKQNKQSLLHHHFVSEALCSRLVESCHERSPAHLQTKKFLDLSASIVHMNWVDESLSSWGRCWSIATLASLGIWWQSPLSEVLVLWVDHWELLL